MNDSIRLEAGFGSGQRAGLQARYDYAGPITITEPDVQAAFCFAGRVRRYAGS